MVIDQRARLVVLNFFKVMGPLARNLANLREQWLKDFDGLMTQVGSGSTSAITNFAGTMANKYTQPFYQIREAGANIQPPTAELGRCHRAFLVWASDFAAANKSIDDIATKADRPETHLTVCRNHLTSAGQRASTFAQMQHDLYERYGLMR